METPICDFIKEYESKNKLRLHMPGHKGKSHLGFESLDITEIPGADVLYDAEGIILESEENASKLFGTERTFYSTEGSSLAIRAMLYLLKIYADDKGKDGVRILASRNSHKTFMMACGLLDLDVDFLSSDKDGLLTCNVTPELLEAKLCEIKDASIEDSKLIAVYLTSPDYLGNILDIAKLSEVCKKYGALLLVDNAHGAYLNFLETSRHPIALGADMCCDSAHKTLPVLTGGAYLHVSKKAPKLFSIQGDRALSMFASTSPSYIIMQSLDMANKYIEDGYPEKLEKFIKEVEKLKVNLKNKGYTFVGNEPLKLTIECKSYGYFGTEFSRILSENGIECEFFDPDYIVLMLTPELLPGDIERLETALSSIERRPSIKSSNPQPKLPKALKVLSMHDAMMKSEVRCKACDTEGKILASPSVACPPAIPILVCGERISKEAIRCFEYYGIESVSVVKE